MTHILLIGFKAAGKSATGKVLAELLDLPFLDLDDVIENLYREQQGGALACREIYNRHGAEYMRGLETEALEKAVHGRRSVIATGGGAVLDPANCRLLSDGGFCVFLDTPLAVLKKRLAAHLSSPLFRNKSVAEVHAERYPLYVATADLRFVPEPAENSVKAAERLARQVREVVHG